MIPELTLWFGPGLGDDVPVMSLILGEGSYNFYPEDGFLRNYPGSKDIFTRQEDPPAYIGDPPPLNETITRVRVFQDRYGNEHTVFVQNGRLRLKQGNGYRDIYVFVGDSHDGLYYPCVFVHNGLLFFLNPGDPPMLWDGFKNPRPIGVRETPGAPSARAQVVPWSGLKAADGMFAYATIWWTQQAPYSGPADQFDISDNRIHGMYSIRLQFFDEYGNKGKVGPACLPVVVAPMTQDPTYLFMRTEYLCSEWAPPLVDPHVDGCIIGRSLNQNPEAATVGGGEDAHATHYVEYTFSAVTPTRFVHQASDVTLLENGAMDESVHPPPDSFIGCGWKQWVVYGASADRMTLYISDAGYFGQCRPTQTYSLKSEIQAAVPMGDRLLVVCRHHYYVFYDNSGIVAMLEESAGNGTSHGWTFHAVEQMAVGLWHDGFMIFDGNSFRSLDSPYWLEGDYIEWQVLGAWYHAGRYIVSLRAGAETTGPNQLAMYDFGTKQWYLLLDSAYDITCTDGVWYVCGASIREVFRGTFETNSQVDLHELMPRGATPNESRNLQSIRLLMKPSSAEEMNVSIEGRFNISQVGDLSALLLPSERSMSRFSPDTLVPYWNKVNALYTQEPRWNDGLCWIEPRTDLKSPGMMHDIRLTFPAGHLVRLKALSLTYSDKTRGT